MRHADYNWFNFFEKLRRTRRTSVLIASARRLRPTTLGQSIFQLQRKCRTFEFVEMDYGMKVVMTKPGPKPGTEFVERNESGFAEYRSSGRHVSLFMPKMARGGAGSEGSPMRALDVCDAQ